MLRFCLFCVLKHIFVLRGHQRNVTEGHLNQKIQVFYVHSCNPPRPLMSHFVLLAAKNFFRVSYRAGGPLQTHYFQASDAFNKQQWINCIRQAKEAVALTENRQLQAGECPPPGLGGQIGPPDETDPGLWGHVERGPCLGEAALDGGADLCLVEENKVAEEVMAGSAADGGTGEGAESDAWKMDGEAETRGDDRDASASFFSSLAPGEEEVMEEEQSGSKEEEEMDMDSHRC